MMKAWASDFRERFGTFETLKGVLILALGYLAWQYPEWIIQVGVAGFCLYEGVRKVLVNRVRQQAKKERLVEARRDRLRVACWPVLFVVLCCLPSQDPRCEEGCRTSESGIALIQRWEGYVPVMYRDAAGYWTIGTGHLMTKAEQRRWRGRALTAAQGDSLLRRDLAAHERHVNRAVRVPLYSWQFDALTSWTFNLGPGNLRRSTMLRRVNAGQHAQVPSEMRRWNRAGGRVLRGLERRREAEARIYARGYDG